VDQEFIDDEFGNMHLNATGWASVYGGIDWVAVQANAYASANWVNILGYSGNFSTKLLKSRGEARCVFTGNDCKIRYKSGIKRGPKNIHKSWFGWGTVRLSAFAHVPGTKTGNSVTFNPNFMAGYGGKIKLTHNVAGEAGGKGKGVSGGWGWESEDSVNDITSGGDPITATCVCIAN